MKTPEVGATDRVCQCVALWGSRTKTRAATTTRSRGELADKGSSDATQFAARCKRRTRRMEMRQQSTELRRQSTRQKHLRNTVHAGGWRQRAGRAGDRGRLASVSDTSHLNTLKYNKSTNTLFQAQARGPTYLTTYYLRTRVQAKPRRTAFGHGRDGVRSPTKYWSVGVARGRFTRRTGRLHPRA